MSNEPVALETVYETIIHWDQAGKRSRRELARRIVALYAHPVDDTALLRQALEVLESVYPYTDSLICYASTVDEHPPNAINGNVRDALTALRERLGEKT